MNRLHWITVGGLGLGLVLLLAGSYRLLIHPLAAAYDDKVAEKKAAEDKLADTQLKAAQLEKFRAEAENVRRDLDFYSRRLDDPLNYFQTDTLVRSLADEYNLAGWSEVIESVGSTTHNMADSAAGYKVTVKYKADLDHTGRFLNSCVQQARIIVPKTLSLKRLSDDQDGAYHNTVDVTLVPEIKNGAGGKK